MFNVLKIYHLFISHSWSYSPHYNTLLEWIDRSNIVFSNYSVPYTDPFTGKTKAQLQEAITEQISHSSIVIIAAGIMHKKQKETNKSSLLPSSAGYNKFLQVLVGALSSCTVISNGAPPINSIIPHYVAFFNLKVIYS